jgi:peptidoglycan/LPS O-acetylase OafA/YrhL
MNPNYIPTLNGWRAIAVLLVIGAHSSTMLRHSGTDIGNIAASIFSHGGIGVDIFFSISGFLICTLLLREKDATTFINLKGFYTRRFFRIVPPMATYLFVVAALVVAGILNLTRFDFVSAALFFKNYTSNSTWYTDHFWSLAVEEHFYLFVPLLLARMRWQSALKAAIGIVIACALIRVAESSLLDGAKVEFRTEARLDAILYGAIWAMLCHRFKSNVQSNLTLRAVVVTVVAACVVAAMFHYMPLRRTVMAIAIPLPIVWTSLNPNIAIGRFLEFWPLQLLGKLSYSLYIWQQMFLVEFNDGRLGIMQDFPFAFVSLISCAVISYYLIERPSIKLGHQLSKRADRVASQDQRGISPERFRV